MTGFTPIVTNANNKYNNDIAVVTSIRYQRQVLVKMSTLSLLSCNTINSKSTTVK